LNLLNRCKCGKKSFIDHLKKDNKQLSIVDLFGILLIDPYFINEYYAHPPKENESNSVEFVEGE
jgi:hypothetical protein